jgi:hypothetical protein
MPATLKINEMETAITSLEMSDAQEYTFMLSTGWITKVSMKRTVKVGDIWQVETYEIQEKQ